MGKRNSRWIPSSRIYWREDRGRFRCDWPPPYPAEPNENSVPEWEKKFCYVVGLVPWCKVLSTKTFASCYPDVMNWDDSEAKDTFDAAKRRFWAKMNGLCPDDVSLPDPNAYIDRIDWNDSVDTDLFMDLDRELLAANAATKEEPESGTTGVVDISALMHNSKWKEWNHGTADDGWGSGVVGRDKSNVGGWGKPENGSWAPVNIVQGRSEITKGAANPWDSQQDKINDPANNSAWGHYNDNSWGWNQPAQFYSTMNPRTVANPNDGKFRSHRVYPDNSRGMNRQQINFNETKGWVYSSIQHNRASKAREWGKPGDHSQFRNSWNNNQHKKTDNYYKKSENQDWGNRGDCKRESPNNYTPRSISPRFQRTDDQRHDQLETVRPWSNSQSMQRAGSSFRPC